MLINIKLKVIKLASLLLFLFLTSSAFSEEIWYISLGAYDNLIAAKTREALLTENGIPAKTRTFKKNDSTEFFRVLFAEKLKSQEQAFKRRSDLLKFLDKLNISDDEVWITSVTENIILPPPPKPKPAPVVAAAPVVPVVPVVIPVADPAKRILTVKDSDTGATLSGANIDIDGLYNLVSDSNGNASLPAGFPDGEHLATITNGAGYVPTTYPFNVINGEITTPPQISIPKAVTFERIKIILDWGNLPEDLDAHCYSDKLHVYHRKKKSGNLILDRDDTDQYGPETITIQEPAANAVYQYYVHNYSDFASTKSTRLSNSEAQVKVYFDNEYKTTFKVTPDQKGVWWHVFDIVNKNEIVPVNEISAKKIN